jgi:hypothetical protein
MSKADNEIGMGDVKGTLREYVILSLTGILDSVYLIAWVIVQWLVDNILSRYHLIGMDSVLLVIFQILFGFTTVFPLCLFIYRDFRIAWLRVNRQIENETKGSRRK